MADNNNYTSKQNIKKYTTQAKFDAIDKSDVPVGTEYNIVGEIEESDLSSELQTKIASITGKQDVITNQTSLNAAALSVNALTVGTSGATISGPLTVNGYSSLNGIFVDNSTTNPICFKKNNSIVTKMYGPTSGGGELVNVYLPGKSGTFAMTDDLTGKQDKLTMGAGLSITGNVIYCNGSLTGVLLDVNNIKISGQLDMSGTMVRGGLTYNFPTKGGTFALTSDIPTGGGGGGSAGVTSIDGKTGAILLGSGLTMGSNNVLSVTQTTNHARMYLHRIVGYFDISSGHYVIMVSAYDGTESEFTSDTLYQVIQQLFEYQYTSSVVIAKADGSTTSWDPTKFEQLYVGTIVDDVLYSNFNEMNMTTVSLTDIPFSSDIVEELTLPIS